MDQFVGATSFGIPESAQEPVVIEDRPNTFDSDRVRHFKRDLAIVIDRGRRQVVGADQGDVVIDKQRLGVDVDVIGNANIDSAFRQRTQYLEVQIVVRRVDNEAHVDASRYRIIESRHDLVVPNHLDVEPDILFRARQQIDQRLSRVFRTHHQPVRDVVQRVPGPVGLEYRRQRPDDLGVGGDDADLAVRFER